MTVISGVKPKSTSFTHEVVLNLPNGQSWGLRMANGIKSVQYVAPQTTLPLQRVGQVSFHLGRGWEIFTQGNMGVWDTQNAWTMTPQKVHPGIWWTWARGLISEDRNWPSSISWKKIGTAGDPYLAVSWASSGFDSANIYFWVRRKGTPGTLTVELCSDNAGKPGTVRQTITLTISNVTDTPALIWNGQPAAYTLAASTTYWLQFRSSDTSPDNCWEIGCDASTNGSRSTDGITYSTVNYSPCYRVTAVNTAQELFEFTYDGATYAVNKLASGGNSTLYINGGRGKATSGASTSLTDTALGMTTNRYANAYIHIIRGTGQGQTRLISSNTATVFTVSSAWDVNPDNTSEYVVYGTPWWHSVGSTGINGFTSAASGSAGLGAVTGMPCVSNRIAYFPQGDSVGIRKMQWNATTKVHDFAGETATGNQGTAYFLEFGYDPTDGPQIWRANRATATGSGGAQTVSRANAAAALATALSFKLPNSGGTVGIYIGGSTTNITGLRFHEGTLFVPKENSLFTVSADKAVERSYSAKDLPSQYNGMAITSAGDGLLYLNFASTLMQLSGGTITDMKRWLMGIPSDRLGHIAAIVPAMGWVFLACDAGSGTSACEVFVPSTMSLHENFRSFAANKRIRSVFWQPNDDAKPWLWTEMNGELVYQVFPASPRPTTDSAIEYMPECVITLPAIDMLTTDPKFFGELRMVSSYLSRAGCEIFIDYQMDNYIGTFTWFRAGSAAISPEDLRAIGVGNSRKISLRYRIDTSSATNASMLENFTLELFSKTKQPKTYVMLCKVSPNQQVKNGAGPDHKPNDLLSALEAMAQSAEVISLSSIDESLDGTTVTMYAMPRADKKRIDPITGEWSGTIEVFLREMGHVEL